RRATVAEPREPIRASRPAPKIARTVTTSLPERPATPGTGPTMTTHRRFATSAATLLSLLAASAAAPAQSTVRASVDAAGGESNQWSGCTWLGESPAFSADDRWVAFESLASNLVSGDTNGSIDIFVKDLATGGIVRVSVDSAGVQGNRDSSYP